MQISEHVSPSIQKKVLDQNESRFLWKQHDDADNLEDFVLEEAKELKEAVELAMLGASAFEVASELGDVFYLFIKRVFANQKPIGQQAIEAAEYAAEVAELAGIDLDKAVNMKVLRNDIKYPNVLLNTKAPYPVVTNIAKRQWTAMGGDEQFSEMYLEMGEELQVDKIKPA